MNSTKWKSLQVMLLSITLLFGFIQPTGVWADGNVTLSQESSGAFVAGSSSQYDLVIQVNNKTSQKITGIEGSIDASRMAERPFSSTAALDSVAAGDTGKLVFSLNGSGFRLDTTYRIPVSVTYNNGQKADFNAEVKVIAKPVGELLQPDDYKQRAEQLERQIRELKGKRAAPEVVASLEADLEKAKADYAKSMSEVPAYSKVNAPRMSIFPNFSAIIPGQVNMLTVTVANTGDTAFNSVSIAIGGLPDGLTLKNTSTLQQVASIAPGGKQSVVFPVEVKKGIKGGNYPINFAAKGTYVPSSTGEDGKALQEYTMEQTFFLTIGSDGSATKRSGLSIENIVAPQSGAIGKDFTVNFSVANRGVAEAKDFKVTVEGAETVVNKTKNIFIENSLPQGQSKTYKVDFLALSNTTSKYYPIKITVEPLTGAASTADGKDPAPVDGANVPIVQYTGVYVQGKDEENKDGVKAPQIMVTKYAYGGKYVEAGKNFELSFVLKNVSDKPLRSIKASLTSDEGTFVPFNTSNSVFVSHLAPGASSQQVITFSTKPDAAQKTVGITVDTAYEDMKGNPVTAKDIISIPVMQKTVLSVDDIMSNPGAMIGAPTSVNVQFYNLGKTVLSNVKVSGSGDFDVQGNKSYFAGNLDPGKSDSYEFSFTPKHTGEQQGKIVFTYEDAAGDTKTYEKAFTVDVTDAPAQSDNPEGDMPVDEPQGSFNKLFLIPGIGFPVIIGAILFVRHRKKKKDQDLEIDED